MSKLTKSKSILLKDKEMMMGPAKDTTTTTTTLNIGNVTFKSYFSGIGAQQKCFDRGIDDNFFVVFQQPLANGEYTNTYTSFIDINMFLDYYNQQPDKEKRFYELIKNGCPEYYDFDFKMEEWEGQTKHEQIQGCIKEFLRVRNEFAFNNDINNMCYKYEDLVILESCGLSKGIDKLSLHIIVRPEMNGRSQQIFKSCRDQKIFQQLFETFLLTQKTKIVLDMSVYSSNSLMRLHGSHKKDDVVRKFQLFGNVTKNIQDKRLLFCSYVQDVNAPTIYIQKDDSKERLQVTDLELSNNEVKDIFNSINSSRWELYESWRTLIWLALKLGLTDGDIHEYSQDANNYDEDATNRMINGYTPERCNISIGTLFFYLKQDVDNKTYNKLVKPYIQDKITQMKIDSLITTDGFIEKHDQWVLPEVLEQNKCTVIKAGLGKGKTTASVAHINSHDYERIIVLTPRRTFAKSVCNRLNIETSKTFALYSNLKKKDYNIKHPNVVIQVESLHRIELDNRKTLLLCDEIESILFQLTVSKTHKNNHVNNLNMFEELFRQSQKIICLDAFISNRTLTTLKTMNIDFSYYNYTRPLENRTCIRMPDIDVFTKKIIYDLGIGKKILFFSTSNNKLVNDFIPLIKSKYPNKKIIEYHSKFSSVDLTKVNDNWKDADIVACTSTITVGCNFDLEHIFDKIFVFANASSRNLVRDVFQATYRIRHISDKQMIYCLDKKHFGINLSTDKNEIETDLKMKIDYIVNQYEQHLQMKFPNKETPVWIKQLVLANVYEQNMSIMSLEEMFKRYLKECNYEHEDLDEDELDDEEIFEEEIIVDQDTKYEDIHSINRDEAHLLRRKKIVSSLTKMEEAQLEKYYFQCILTSKKIWKKDVEIDLWYIYQDYGKGKFTNLSYEKGVNAGSVRISDIVSDIYPEIAGSLALKVELIGQITKMLELKNSQDFKSIPRDKLEAVIYWFKQNSQKIHNVFEIRNQKKVNKFDLRTTTDLINKVLSSWGYSKLKKGKRQQQQINGERLDISPFNVVNENKLEGSIIDIDIDVYEHIKPRDGNKTERNVNTYKGVNPMLSVDTIDEYNKMCESKK